MTWCQILLFLTISFLITHFGINEIVKLTKLSKNAKINNNVIFKLKANSLLTYWLWIFLCASLMNSWFWWKYIFGMIIIAKSILGMTSTIVNELKQFKWMAIVELVLSVGLGCYLLYTIPDTELRDVVVQITSSIVGGVLTLVGVAWTIRHTNKDRQLANKRFQYDKKLEGYQLVLEIYRNVENGKSTFINKDRKALPNILRSCPHCTPFLTNSPNFESIQNIIKTPLLDEPRRNFLFKKDWLEQRALAVKMMFYSQSQENAILVFNFMMSYRKTLECLHQTFVVWYNIWKQQEEKNQQESALDGDYVDKYLSDNEENIELKKNIELLYQYYFEIKEKNILDWIEQQIMI